MVSTRHHPRPFPEPTLPPSRSPGKDTSTSTSSSPTKTSTPPSPTVEIPPAKRTPARRSTRKSIVEATSEEPSTTTTLTRTRSKRGTRSPSARNYVHHPNSVVIAWLLVSLPLVVWDTLYIYGRPNTMPGGSWHSPFWTPYALYGSVDYMYGWPQWDQGNGFTAAQGSLNVVETVMYGYYLYVVFSGVADGWKSGVIDKLFREQTKGRIGLEGPHVATAVVVCWASAVMTVSKTVLYWLNELFSSFVNIGHNSVSNLVWLWIIPNGAWLVLPTYMIYVLGGEVVSAMHLAGESPDKED